MLVAIGIELYATLEQHNDYPRIDIGYVCILDTRTDWDAKF